MTDKRLFGVLGVLLCVALVLPNSALAVEEGYLNPLSPFHVVVDEDIQQSPFPPSAFPIPHSKFLCPLSSVLCHLSLYGRCPMIVQHLPIGIKGGFNSHREG